MQDLIRSDRWSCSSPVLQRNAKARIKLCIHNRGIESDVHELEDMLKKASSITYIGNRKRVKSQKLPPRSDKREEKFKNR